MRTEYIGGGISQRKLAMKYGTTYAAIRNRAEKDGWIEARKDAQRKAAVITAQKIAEAKSDNAAVAQRIKAKLLRKLEKEIDALPEKIGSESSGSIIEWGKSKDGNKVRKETTQVNNLRQLTQAFKDLTEDMDLNGDSEQVRIIIDV